MQPGRTPISIVTNEMSKRKTPALVAFHNGDRLLGAEAEGIIGRVPGRVYAKMRDAAGKPAGPDSDVLKMFADNYLPYDTEVDERGSLVIKTHTGDKYDVEEMISMIIHYCHRIGNAASTVEVQDTVVTIPPFFGQAQRRAIIDAAEASGVNLLSLVHTHSAAALNYGIERDFKNGTESVIFFDMGATSTEAALVEFSSYKKKSYGKSKEVGQFKVKDVVWDHTAGVEQLETILARHFAAEFQEKSGIDILKEPKSMAKLKKACKKTKEVLSANKDASVSVTSLYEDTDFSSTITRETFEELAGDLFDRAAKCLKDVIGKNKVDVKKLKAVELLGGGSRVPKMQDKLTEVLNGRALDRHMDADEAVALGAGLFAANQSSTFRLREFGMLDGSPFEFEVQLQSLKEKDSEEWGEPETRTLIPRFKKLPFKRSITFANFSDHALKVSTKYGRGALPPGVSEPIVATYSVTGMDSILSKNNLTEAKLGIYMEMDSSGLLTLDSADLTFQVEKMVETEIQVPIIENATAAENATEPAAEEGAAANATEPAAEEGAAANGTEAAPPPEPAADANATAADADAAAGNGTAADANATAPPKKEKPKKEKPKKVKYEKKKVFKQKTVTMRPKLNVTVIYEAVPSADKAKQMKFDETLVRLEANDRKKKENEGAKNALESFVIETRSQLTEDEVEEVSTEEERETLRDLCNEKEDWLYMEGDKETAKVYKEELAALKKLWDPIHERMTELQLRVPMVKKTKKFIADMNELLLTWNTTRPWMQPQLVINQRKKLDDLQASLDEKLAKQEKLALTEAPAFTAGDLQREMRPIELSFERMKKMKKPRNVKAPPPPKEETPADGANGTAPANGTAAPPSNATEDLPPPPAAEEAAPPPAEEAAPPQEEGEPAPKEELR